MRLLGLAWAMLNALNIISVPQPTVACIRSMVMPFGLSINGALAWHNLYVKCLYNAECKLVFKILTAVNLF